MDAKTFLTRWIEANVFCYISGFYTSNNCRKIEFEWTTRILWLLQWGAFLLTVVIFTLLSTSVFYFSSLCSFPTHILWQKIIQFFLLSIFLLFQALYNYFFCDMVKIMNKLEVQEAWMQTCTCMKKFFIQVHVCIHASYTSSCNFWTFLANKLQKLALSICFFFGNYEYKSSDAKSMKSFWR